MSTKIFAFLFYYTCCEMFALDEVEINSPYPKKNVLSYTKHCDNRPTHLVYIYTDDGKLEEVFNYLVFIYKLLDLKL